ncbi:MAG: transporter substrate-binding domain-containing protein [Burkholderiales bacterium]|nr:transporter substrate-binding domain-containing protein [Burkholderiales bacterium]MBH2017921.1 transporter substrate-binding domain-containing protein [Burkholderiales bacterium]
MLKRVWWGWCLGWCVFAAPLAHAETITVAAEDDWPPYSHAQPGTSEPQGVAPRIVRAAFKTQGIDVRFVVLPFARCLMEAEKGRVVGCFNVTRTRANENTFIWHPTPMFEEELAIFGRVDAEHPAPARSLSQADLRGRSVGITVGYTYPTDFMRDPAIRRIEATSDRSLLRMLAAGRVDHALVNTLPAYHRVAHVPELQGRVARVGSLRVDGFWLSFSKAHADGARLAGVFEQGLQSLRRSGEHARLMATLPRGAP